ncbi:MAG TPA: YegS/Rv2252/BmrU family lipid kinase [Syntrophomonadaceae bacterium]|nr:YegS/Rv2252/BmrU family lipid kinase [Syntrophomonadaceae bacterium]
MKDKIALFYNPVAGGGRFEKRLASIVQHFQNQGFQLEPWRITSNADIADDLRCLDPDELHTIAAAGGDGTVHGLVNAMMDCGLQVPIAIFPEGTSNDVAHYLSIPAKAPDYCNIVTHGRLMDLDLGRVNGRYFVNIASGGLLTETAHEVEYFWKNLLGRGAYFLKGLGKIPLIQSLDLTLTVDGHRHQLEVVLFVILNGGTAGGFQGIIPEGKMSDGQLDFVAIRPVSLARATQLLYKIMRKQLLQDENIFYCQGKHFLVDLKPPASTDLDGEKGPALPWDIEVIPAALKIWIPSV